MVQNNLTVWRLKTLSSNPTKQNLNHGVSEMMIFSFFLNEKSETSAHPRVWMHLLPAPRTLLAACCCVRPRVAAAAPDGPAPPAARAFNVVPIPYRGCAWSHTLAHWMERTPRPRTRIRTTRYACIWGLSHTQDRCTRGDHHPLPAPAHGIEHLQYKIFVVPYVQNRWNIYDISLQYMCMSTAHICNIQIKHL